MIKTALVRAQTTGHPSTTDTLNCRQTPAILAGTKSRSEPYINTPLLNGGFTVSLKKNFDLVLFCTFLTLFTCRRHYFPFSKSHQNTNNDKVFSTVFKQQD